MNVASAKMWLRALLDILPDIAISAPWLPYAEVNIDRDRGLRDAFACIDHHGHDGAVAVGGEFSMGMCSEWDRFGKLNLPRIDLTKPPMPERLNSSDDFSAMLTTFRPAVIKAFQPFLARAAA